MVAGHTKFEPDWHFGIWKCRWRNSNADTLQDIAQTVAHSSRGGHNIPQLTTDDTDPVTFSNWRLFLGQFFKPLKNISKFHHFTFDILHPGTVICKAFSNSEEVKVSLLKPNIVIKKEDKPQELTAPGLDSNRQWYLYQQIRQYCRTEAAKDLTCPKPNCPKSAVKTKDDEHDSRKSFKRKSSVLQ